jgi:hypothetical protein
MRLFHFQNKQSFLSGKIYLCSLMLLFLLSFSFVAHAQNYPTTPNSLSPAVQPTLKVNKRTREVKRVQPNVKHSSEYEFYDRVQKVAKAKKRALRKLAKPQYTNPVYFGHKNIPKKHAPHKMRFCNECGIRH